MNRTLQQALHAVGMAEHPDKAPAARSPQWPKARAAWLREHPACEACGGTDHVEVHHRVPFSWDASRELDKTNFVTLCEKGPGCNCHLHYGHCGNWKFANSNVDRDASWAKSMIGLASKRA